MVCIRCTYNTSEGLLIRSINKEKIFEYQMKVKNRSDGTVVFNINFLNEENENVLIWKLELTNEWLDKIDVRNVDDKTYRETLDYRIERMIQLIQTENCSFDLPTSEEEFFTTVLYN